MGPIIAIIFTVITGWLLLKKYNPHAVLLASGLSMLTISMFLEYNLPSLKNPTGLSGFDLFRYIKESFSKTNAGVGLMIMAIGGFVAYIDVIGASNALVHLAMRPLKLFKNKPYIAASLVIPLGQVLFVAIPSAAGLSLLLMASLFPILVKLGVSRLSAVSVITATTAFGIGPASAITASATQIADVDSIVFFIKNQIPMVVPLSISMMVTYYFVNRYFDKNQVINSEDVVNEDNKLNVPLIYALIPVLPIILLLVFSKIFNAFSTRPLKSGVNISIFTSGVFFLILSMQSLK